MVVNLRDLGSPSGRPKEREREGEEGGREREGRKEGDWAAQKLYEMENRLQNASEGSSDDKKKLILTPRTRWGGGVHPTLYLRKPSDT